MTRALDDACAMLTATDARLQRGAAGWHTLDPERERPRALTEIALQLLASDVETDAQQIASCAQAFERIALAQLEHFPGNLFWDFDFIAGTLVGLLRREGPQALERMVQRFVALQASFGCHSPIRFRYVHDFVYGFDWQRFVMSDPDAHRVIGPFDDVFLERVQRRGAELRASIERGDDPKYGRLPSGVYRNPFSFSREPADELRLHRALARAGHVPVEAWRVDARPRWQLPATRLRLECAKALGLAGAA